MTAPPTSQTNPLDPVFSGVPVTIEGGAVNPTWNKWFVDLREKVNVINQTLATLSGGSIDPSTGALAVSSGGTGATTVAGAQTNLGILGNPMTAAGDIIIGGTGGTPTRLPAGANTYVLTMVSGVPAWAAGGGGGGYSNYLIPPFANVSALLHFNGTNGSTTFTDQVSGNTWTATNATISTAQSLFGGGSGLFTGASNSGIAMPTNSKFNVGTNPWTIEFSIYPIGAHQTYAKIFATRNGDAYSGIAVQYVSGQTFNVYMSLNGSSWAISGVAPFTLVVGVWNRVLIQYTGGVIQSYVNGFLQGTASESGLSPYYNSADSVVIGGPTSGTSRSINAYVDEFRFTNGLALVSAYPPLSSEFPNS